MPQKTSRHSENVCQTRPDYKRKMVRLSVTVDEGTLEWLNVLAEFGDNPKPLSHVVNEILYESLKGKDFSKSYDRWKKKRP